MKIKQYDWVVAKAIPLTDTLNPWFFAKRFERGKIDVPAYTSNHELGIDLIASSETLERLANSKWPRNSLPQFPQDRVVAYEGPSFSDGNLVYNSLSPEEFNNFCVAMNKRIERCRT